jgi:hypothetical protein
MALLRHQPGDIAPWTGTYVLVGHYGEATDLAAVWRNAGERLPSFTGVADSGQFWFVQVHEANEQSRVA